MKLINTSNIHNRVEKQIFQLHTPQELFNNNNKKRHKKYSNKLKVMYIKTRLKI